MKRMTAMILILCLTFTLTASADTTDYSDRIDQIVLEHISGKSNIDDPMERMANGYKCAVELLTVIAYKADVDHMMTEYIESVTLRYEEKHQEYADNVDWDIINCVDRMKELLTIITLTMAQTDAQRLEIQDILDTNDLHNDLAGSDAFKYWVNGIYACTDLLELMARMNHADGKMIDQFVGSRIARDLNDSNQIDQLQSGTELMMYIAMLMAVVYDGTTVVLLLSDFRARVDANDNVLDFFVDSMDFYVEMLTVIACGID